MTAKFIKLAGPAAIALLFFAWAYTGGLHAQSTAKKSSPPPLTTNWVGCLVVGRPETSDPIARGAYPTTIRQVEIGLRSDGVVIWREAPPAR